MRPFSLSVCSLLVLVLFVIGWECDAQPRTVRINRTARAPEEVSIAINPANPANLVAGANTALVCVSEDSGKTWVEYTLPPGTYGDPGVAFDLQGRAYFTHLLNTWDAIMIRTSDDHGHTWNGGVKLYGPNSAKAVPGPYYNSSLQDKPFLTVDQSFGPHGGNVYVAWTDFSKYGSSDPRDSSVIVFARSTNRGESFEPWVRVSDKAGSAEDGDNTMEGAVPAVGPNGEVYLSWAGPEGIYFDKSLDGGRHWGRDTILTALPGGWDFDIPGISRANGMPVTVADISSSPHRGTVYVNWVDFRNGDPDVFVMSSRDSGRTWDGPHRVNSDAVHNGRMQFFHWAAVDAITGELAIVFYDRRRVGGDSTEVWLARSRDGGRSFTNECISTLPFLPVSSVFFGDYNGLAIRDGMVRPIWTEMRDRTLSIHTALVDPSPSTSVDPVSAAVPFLSHFPNPLTLRESRAVFIPFSLTRPGIVEVEISDIAGRSIRRQSATYPEGSHVLSLEASSLHPGTYLYRVSLRSPGASREDAAKSGRITVIP